MNTPPNHFHALAIHHRQCAAAHEKLADAYAAMAAGVAAAAAVAPQNVAPAAVPTLPPAADLYIASDPEIVSAATPDQLSRIAAHWPDAMTADAIASLRPRVLAKVRAEQAPPPTAGNSGNGGNGSHNGNGSGRRSDPPTAAPSPPAKPRIRLPGDPP